MRTRLRLVGVACALTLGLVGCTETPSVTRTAAPTAAPTVTRTAPDAGESTSTSDLAALKKVAGIADCPTSDPDTDPVARGLPDVILPCLGGGRPVHLAGLRGRPMMINVWAQWCGPCRDEAPYLAEVATLNGSNLLVLGLNFQESRPELALEFARFASWRYPQLSDPDEAIKAPLQLAAMPQTFFVRADGTIAHRQTRPFSSAEEIRALAGQYLGVTP